MCRAWNGYFLLLILCWIIYKWQNSDVKFNFQYVCVTSDESNSNDLHNYTVEKSSGMHVIFVIWWIGISVLKFLQVFHCINARSPRSFIKNNINFLCGICKCYIVFRIINTFWFSLQNGSAHVHIECFAEHINVIMFSE